MRRFAKILLWTAGGLLTLVLLAGIVVETPFFKNWLRGVIVRQANQRLNGTLDIGQFSGNLLTGAELHDVSLTVDNEKVGSIGDVKVHYSIPKLIGGGTTVDSVTIDHPVIDVRRENGQWQLARLLKPSNSNSTSTRAIAVNHIVITNGVITVGKNDGISSVNVPDKFTDIDAALSYSHVPDKSTTIGLDRLSFNASNPSLELRQASGQVTVTDNSINISMLNVRTAGTAMSVDGAIAQYKTKTPTLALQASVTPLSLPEVHRLVPAMKAIDLTPTINVKLGGPTSRLATEASVQSRAGDVSFKGTVSVTPGPDRVYSGEVAVHHLDLAPILDNPDQKSDINVYAKVDLHGPSGLDTLRGSVAADAPSVETHGYLVEGIHANAVINGRQIQFTTSELAYRSNTTAAGSVQFASDERPETRFDLHGVVKDIGIAYLPRSFRIPPAETKLTADYHVHIVIPRTPGWHVDGDVVLAKSTVAGVTIGDGAKASFLFEPNVTQYRADMNVLDVNLQRIGRQFAIAALSSPRYQTSLNGHVVADVHGTALDTMTLKATGELRDSSLFGGTVPKMTFASELAGGDLHVTASGRLEHINPAIAAAKPSLDGSVTGDIEDVDLTLHHLPQGIDLNSIDAYVLADFAPVKIGKYGIDSAYVQADYHDALVDVQYLDAYGADIVAQGNGTIALNDTGQSGFWIHAEASHLEQAAQVADVGKGLTGAGTIDAVITGNKSELAANGTITANGIRYQSYGALSSTTKFSARIPDLNAQQASITADTQATFVDIPGFKVNELTAHTEYADKHIRYDVTAKQPMRELTSQGDIVLHPDHNEVHLTKFRLASQNMVWQNVEGHVPAIQWGGGEVIVKDFALTDATGMQQMLANGTFGAPGAQLMVQLKDFNLSSVDAFLLRPPQLSGDVNATAVISGTTDAPVVAADFAIRDGRFRNVPWQSFTGNVKYTPARIVLDTTLRENDMQWLTAKGELPMSFVRGRKTSDMLDLHVDSSAIDLGLVQGFTTAVTGVTGTLQAKLDLTGTSADPRVAGGITISNGGLKVQDTGVVYTALNGRVDFLPDRVHINDLYVLDNDNDSLSLTGDLGVSGFSVSNINLGVYADNFKVLGNQLGDLHVNSSLALSGTLAHPRLEGDLGITTGTIKLDQILASFNSAYSTTSIDTSRTAGPDTNTRSGLLGGLELGVHLTVPNDLVVKADDLTVGNAPIGLGKLNLTLGGDLNIAAAPDKPITLVGQVNTVRGFYDYQGRRFTILRDGKVQFQGDPVNQLNPALDVTGERMIQAVTVHVNVRGRLRKPQIELTSVPPQDQADILALIIFNQPLNELGTGQQLSLAQRAGSIAAGAVTSQLTGSIANSLNLDQFEVKLAPESGSAAELTVGQQLGQNLYVKVQQGLGGANNQTNLVLEYEFTKWLRLQTNVLEGSTTQEQLFQRVKSTGVDLVLSFAFK